MEFWVRAWIIGNFKQWQENVFQNILETVN